MAYDNTPGFSLPPPAVTAPTPGGSLDPRRYTYSRASGSYTPPTGTQPPAPVVETPKPTTGMVVGGNQGVGGLGSSPTNPNLNMQDYLRNNVGGQDIWSVMQKLPDAYQAALYQALVGTGGNYDPTSGNKGQNDLWGTVLHNKFGGNHDQLNQWVNYWNHTNANARPTFDPSTGKFHYLDVGYDLDKAQYQQHLNDFWTHEGTGQSVYKNLSDFGVQWDPSKMGKIGEVPWYQPATGAITGAAPFGMGTIPGVTPATTPISTPGTPGGYGNAVNPNVTQFIPKPQPTGGTTVPTVDPYASGTTSAGPGVAPAPSITTPPPQTPVNPTGAKPTPGQYRYQPGMWGRQS